MYAGSKHFIQGKVEAIYSNKRLTGWVTIVTSMVEVNLFFNNSNLIVLQAYSGSFLSHAWQFIKTVTAVDALWLGELVPRFFKSSAGVPGTKVVASS